MALNAPQKAALVMLGLDEDIAVQVMRQLDPAEVRQLSRAVESLDPIPKEALEPTLVEFERMLGARVLPRAGADYMKRLTAGAWGEDEAVKVLKAPPTPGKALESIRAARSTTLADILNEEHPQVAAAIISQFPREQAAKVLLALPEEKQLNVISRIAKLDQIPNKAIVIASEALVESLESSGGLSHMDEGREFDGVGFAASLINEMGSDDMERVLDWLEEAESDLAPKIREAMFTFEDLQRLDKRSLQTLMRDVAADRLLVALKSASEALREVFFGAVSKRAAESMREDLEILPPKRLSEVEAAQREIVDLAVQLSADGKIQLPTTGEEELV
jgi:flagellar motor switch protein FliG